MSHIIQTLMTITKFYAIALLPFALTACTLVEVTQDEAPTENQEESLEEILEEQPVRETNNVTYTGTVQPAGISIYQQGSHRLSLPGGKFILLEAESLDLNGYVGEDVTIFGSLRPTVEAGGMIMRVERIELVEPKEEDVDEQEDEESDDVTEEEELTVPVEEELPVNTGDEPVEEEVQLEPGDEESADPDVVLELPDIEAEEPTEEPDEEEEAAIEEVPEVVSAEFTERVEVMSRQDYTPANWTQQYCSSHIGFCNPVHRNWWFKSFGTTNNKLWHVELSSAPIDAMGQGPISVDLLAGDIPVANGTIDDSNGTVVGYTEWTFGRHFVISADSSLKEAVQYITKNITEYVQ